MAARSRSASRPARSFAPPGDRQVRLSHLDPRPLYPAAAPVASPWRSPTFWLASAIVLPCAAVAAGVRGVARLI